MIELVFNLGVEKGYLWSRGKRKKLIKFKNCLHDKKYHEQRKKTTHKLGENIYIIYYQE